MRFRYVYALCTSVPVATVAALDWVSVDSSGRAIATYTTAAPPSALTSTAANVLLLPVDGSGHTASEAALATATATATTTGVPPVASAVGPGSAGAFLLCNRSGDRGVHDDDDDGGDRSSRNAISTPEDGAASPFCQPADGAQVQPGSTYYVTWDPSSFDANTSVTIAATYSNGNGNGNGNGNDSGSGLLLTDSSLDAAAGFYAWTLPETFLQDQPGSGSGSDSGADAARRLAVTWSLVYNSSTGAGRTQQRIMVGGPTVVVTASPITAASRHSRVPIAAVAVPVIVGVALLAALFVCVCTYRHQGRLPLVGRLVAWRTSTFSAKGYCSGGGGGGGITSGGSSGIISSPRAVFDPERRVPPSPRPAPGVNVFREELKRQQQEEEERQR